MSKPKLNNKSIADICKAIRIGATYDLACKYAGVSYASFRNWIIQAEKGDTGLPLKLLESVRKAEGDAAAKWLLIIDQAAPKEWQAAAWKLERRYPGDYGRRSAPEANSDEPLPWKD